MTVYVCDSEAKLPKWRCPDMTEEGNCGKPRITCQYRGKEVN